MKHIALISTGGTIEKTYDELAGVMANRVSVLDVMLASLQLRGITIDRVALMNKDSLDMTEDDHNLIAATAAQNAATHDGVVIVHGTDRLAKTGHRIFEKLFSPLQRGAGEGPGVRASTALRPIVLTGAMRPYEMRSTDALQNLTEALMAVQTLQPGVYVVMHSQVLQFPGVEKDPTRGTFVKAGH